MKRLLTLFFSILFTSVIAQPIVNPLTVERRAAFEKIKTPPVLPEKVNTKRSPNLQETALPYMEWQSPVHNFGVVNRGKPVSGIFAFRNIGAEPILIKDAKGVCGCTGVEYPKQPILPGEIAEIIATYDAEVIGPFKKEVMVQTNLDAADEKTVLYIEGEVIWQF